MMIELPVAVLADEVFVHLGIVDVVTCSLVSRDWLAASRSPRLWLRLHRIHFGDGADPGCPSVLAGGVVLDWRRAASFAHQITTRTGSVSMGMTGARVRNRSGATAAVLPETLSSTAGPSVMVLGGNTDDYQLRPSADLLDVLTGEAAVVDIPVVPHDGHAGYSTEVLGSWLQGCAVSAKRLFLFGGKRSNTLWELILLQAPTRTPRGVYTDPLTAEKGSAKFARLGPPLTIPEGEAVRWPPSRVGHSFVVVDGGLICFGGRHTDPATREDRLLNDLWRYDVRSGRWTELSPSGPVPSPRWCHSVATLEDADGPAKMVIFGGWRYPDSVFLNDLYVYELSTNTYARLEISGPLPSPRCQSSLFQIPRRPLLVLFGGASHKDEQGFQNVDEAYGTIVVDLCDLWVFDLSTRTWLRCAGDGQPVLRGGVNAHTRIYNGEPAETVLVIGGMHSDEGASMPRFVGDVAALSVDLRSPRPDDDVVVIPPHWHELGANICHCRLCR